MRRTKNVRLFIRVNERELEELRQRAEAQETTMSDLARASIFQDAKK